MNGIKNIVFDLGGVLLNISFDQTADAFRRLGVENFDAFYSKEKADQLFESLEKGAISDSDFLGRMQQYCTTGTGTDEVKAAWNAILLNFREKSVAHLHELSSRYRIFLLSNTNSIHHASFQQNFMSVYGRSLDSLFEKAWYSHVIGLRKPHPAIFHWALQDAGLMSTETLFIDDTAANIAGAQAAGMKVHHLQEEERIENLGL